VRKIQVDLGVIEANFRQLRTLTPAKIMAIVKADAFGHGLIEVSKRLELCGVDMLATADLDEALQLREAGVRTPLLAWLHAAGTNFCPAIENDIQIGLSTTAGVEQVAVAANTAGTKARIHLKVDTGLGRNGAVIADWPRLVETSLEQQSKGLIELVGVFSHLSGTSQEEDLKQLAVFNDAVDKAQMLGANIQIRHLAASSATLGDPRFHLDMVRVGIALYGLDPNPTTKVADFGLVAAMRVTSEVVSVKRVPKGHGVSYGYLHVTDKPTNLALVPFGYAEGMPRVATGRASVLMNGKRYLIQGRIAMDQFVLDVGDDDVSVGDEVVIIGRGDHGEPTAEDLAAASDTINYEIVTRMGGRAKREFK